MYADVGFLIEFLSLGFLLRLLLALGDACLRTFSWRGFLDTFPALLSSAGLFFDFGAAKNKTTWYFVMGDDSARQDGLNALTLLGYFRIYHRKSTVCSLAVPDLKLWSEFETILTKQRKDSKPRDAAMLCKFTFNLTQHYNDDFSRIKIKKGLRICENLA